MLDSTTSLSVRNALHPRVAQLLFARGIVTKEEQNAFLDPDYSSGIHDPFLFDDMERAVKRIIRAKSLRERITIYGDYDLDGLCASALLYDIFTVLGCDVHIAINHRERDGYGLNVAKIGELIDDGTRLIITTDSGISNYDEIALAVSRGTDVIITDHHTVPSDPNRIPPALAILHPRVRADRYPCKDLSGGGVAFKLVQALIRFSDDADFTDLKTSLKNPNGTPLNWEGYEKWLLDLVCLSTIGDCVPLRGENRVMVKFGLMVLGKTRRVGLRALLASSASRDKKVSPRTVGFVIGPRLNAASRMDHARPAFDLLVTHHEDKATKLVGILNDLNIERQRLTDRIFQEAMAAVQPALEGKKKVLVACGDTWPVSVLGLVAGKIVSATGIPVVLLSKNDQRIAGAGRSPNSFHLTKAFASCEELFDRFGGHRNAGGFTLKPSVFPIEFQKRFESVADEHFSGSEQNVHPIRADLDVSLEELDLDFARALASLEPYGQGNEQPVFCVRGAVISDMRFVGAGEKHVRITLEQNGCVRCAVGFSFAPKVKKFSVGSRVTMYCTVDINNWNGITQAQLTLTHIESCVA